MSRPVDRRARILVAMTIVAATGCAQTGTLGGSLAWWQPAAKSPAAEPFKPETKAAAEPAKKESPTEVATAKPAPSDKPDAAKPATEVAAAKPPGPAPDAAPDANAAPAKADEPAKSAGAAAETASSKTHDAETLKMIEQELAAVSPGERAKLYDEFRSLDGEMVRQVIRINRMVRELDAAKSQAAPPTASLAQAPPNAEPASRVLPLGNVPAEPASIPVIQQTAASLPAAPAAQTAKAAAPTVEASVSRPVPVLEAVVGASASSAAPSVATDVWGQQTRQLITAAEARAEQMRAAYPGDPAAGIVVDSPARQAYIQSQVHLRLLYLMTGDQARAVQAIPGLASAEQEFWQQTIWGLANYFDSAALPARPDRLTQSVEQLRTAVGRMQGEANLQLKNVAFCHKIASFGSYEKFAKDEFAAAQEVMLYAEIVNFKSVVQPADGQFKTQIKSTIEVFRAGQGQPVSKVEFEPTVDLCRSYRQDYFHNYLFRIPADATLGPHVVKLTIEDMLSGKVATYNINFTVK